MLVGKGGKGAADLKRIETVLFGDYVHTAMTRSVYTTQQIFVANVELATTPLSNLRHYRAL